VLADEPTAALDPANARTVVQLLVELVREIDCGLLLISHEPELTARAGLEPLELDWTVAADAWRTRVTRAEAAVC
jgi:ABC-type lipoprotein export system ATPase subunit